jgi:hypothetical protein
MVINSTDSAAPSRPGSSSRNGTVGNSCSGCGTTRTEPELSFPAASTDKVLPFPDPPRANPNNPPNPSPEILAQLLLATLGMKLESRAGNAPGDPASAGRPGLHPWLAEEQDAFNSDLRTLTVPVPASSPARQLQLCSPVTSNRAILPPRVGPAAPAPVSAPRRGRARPRRLLVPVLLLGILGFLGYTAATQSFTALQSAWSSTDTGPQIESVHAQARTQYSLEQGIIPGPFAQVPTGWQALMQHLRPTTAGGPPATP